MRRNMLERYARTDRGEVVLEVSANRVEDLFNQFDKVAPYQRKDLDQDLVEYLIECAREIGRRRFVVRIHLGVLDAATPVERVRKSIHSYFVYLEAVERRRMRAVFRTSMVLLVVGLVLLVVSIWANRMLGDGGSVFEQLIGEGLMVAAWVSLWEALATFLIQWPSHRRGLRVYRRLAGAPVEFARSA